MIDARIWLICTLLAEPGWPVKYYVSLFPRSRGTFFKTKNDLVELQVITDSTLKRGYMDLDVQQAISFMEDEYPSLSDLIAVIDATSNLSDSAAR